MQPLINSHAVVHAISEPPSVYIKAGEACRPLPSPLLPKIPQRKLAANTPPPEVGQKVC